MSMVEPASPERKYQGIGVSPGIARGVAFVHHPEEPVLPIRDIDAADVPAEIARFEASLVATRKQILALQQRIAENIGAKDASIFDAHLLVVEDRTLVDQVVNGIRTELKNAEFIFSEVTDRFARTLAAIDDPYLRERVVDIHDVARRVLRNLTGHEASDLSQIANPHIVVAHNLSPSDTAALNRALALGFATEVGSKTSHTAIMARSLNIPAVVGLHEILSSVSTGDRLLLDGYNGVLVVNPTEQTLWEYGEIEVHKQAIEVSLTRLRETESTTRDGHHIILSANIELPDEVHLARTSGAEGIGLYRTEFLYLNRESPPDEEEQLQNYLRVAEAARPHSVIIRTLDLGGDKVHASLGGEKEANPFLGLRAIRFCLENPALFKTQLRAILRASITGNVRIMYPMISGVQEIWRANALLNICKEELRREGLPFADQVDVGCMIEIPSAALSADFLAREVSFFSIGTNDLIQYSIAVDRVNEQIAHLYSPTHPAIIRLLRMVVDAAHHNGIWVGVCGEMAGDILLTPLLVGLGIDELSTGAALVPRVKRAIQSLDVPTCTQLLDAVRPLSEPNAILAKCEEIARAHYGDLLA